MTRRPATDLSRDQVVVLRHLAAGYHHSEIARRLHITTSGLSMRVLRAVRLLGARTTAQAVYVTARRGLLDNVPTPNTGRGDR